MLFFFFVFFVLTWIYFVATAELFTKFLKHILIVGGSSRIKGFVDFFRQHLSSALSLILPSVDIDALTLVEPPKGFALGSPFLFLLLLLAFASTLRFIL